MLLDEKDHRECFDIGMSKFPIDAAKALLMVLSEPCEEQSTAVRLLNLQLGPWKASSKAVSLWEDIALLGKLSSSFPPSLSLPKSP